MLFGPLAAVLLALLPGAIAWWTGRDVRGRVDDPALPELLLHRQRQLRYAVAVAVAVLAVLGGRSAAWAIPLALVALAVGGYPLRRAMLDESWGPGAYLWHAGRRFIGAAGLWVAIAFAPALVLAPATLAGAAAVAAALGALLLAWGWSVAPLWRLAYGATPLAARPDLAPGLGAVVARSTAPRPAVLRFGAPGERTAAAYALPRHGTPGAVVFSDALLELLEPAEAVAVFAHEVAHLEQLTPRRLARSRGVTMLLALGAVAVPLALRAWEPASSGAAVWAWPLVVVVGVLLTAGGTRGKAVETASDLRAAELCGDGEALVRALTKLHAAMRLPRRWPVEVERVATHPSLARRIQALRGVVGGDGAAGSVGGAAPVSAWGAGGPPQQQSATATALRGNQNVAAATPSTPPAAPTVLRARTAGSWVALDERRLHIFDGVPDAPADGASSVEWLAANAAGARTVAYERLSDLRVEGDAGRAGTRLVALERSGRRWSVPLDPAAARAARVAIDVVDVRLGPPPADRRTERALGTVLAAATGLLMILGGQVGVVLLAALFAAGRPTAAALGALGAMALVRSALSLVAGREEATGARWGSALVAEGAAPLVAILVPLLAAAALWLAVREARRRSAEDALGDAPPDDPVAARGVVTLLVVLGALAAVYGAAAAWAAARGMASVLTPASRTLAVLLAGLGAALAADSWAGSSRGDAGRRRARAGAAVFGVLGALALALPAAAAGSGASLPGAAPELRWERVHAAAGATASLGGVGHDLDLSPSATRFAVRHRAAPPGGDESGEEEGDYDAYGDEISGAPPRVVIGSLDGAAPRELDALGAAFLDDDELLVLARRGDSLELRLERADGAPASPRGSSGWRVTLPPVAAARLRVSGAARAWTVAGWDRRRGGAVALAGRVGDAGVRAQRWAPAPGPGGVGGYSSVAPAANGHAVGVRLRGAYQMSDFLSLAGIAPWESELWWLEGDGGRRVATVPGFVHCADATPAGAPVVCATMDRGRSTLLAVGAEGVVRSAGAFRDVVSVVAPGPDGRLAVAEPTTGEVVIVDPARGRASRLALPPELRHPTELRWTTGGLALLTYAPRGMRVTVVRPPAAGG